MVLVPKGTWWRESATDAVTKSYLGVAIASTRTMLVGNLSGGPLIAYINTANLGDLSPTVTQVATGHSDLLVSIDYIPTPGIDEAIAVGENGRVDWTLNQGLNWNSTILGIADLNDIAGVAPGATQWIAPGVNVIWGRDGFGTWTTRWTGTRPWSSVAYRASAGWVVVAQDGYATQSPTGLNGTFITPYQVAAVSFTRIRANSSYFIAIGLNGAIYRSATGLSGSWTDISIGGSSFLFGITPLAADNNWAISDLTGKSWYTSDNGTTWTENRAATPQPLNGLTNNTVYAVGAGGSGHVYVSFDQEQADFVTTATAPVPPAAFSANDDMSGDAVRRLVTQFRSGRG